MALFPTARQACPNGFGLFALQTGFRCAERQAYCVSPLAFDSSPLTGFREVLTVNGFCAVFWLSCAAWGTTQDSGLCLELSS